MPVRSSSIDEWFAMLRVDPKALLTGFIGGCVAGYFYASSADKATISAAVGNASLLTTKNAELSQKLKESEADSATSYSRQERGGLTFRPDESLNVSKGKSFQNIACEQELFGYAFDHFQEGVGVLDSDVGGHFHFAPIDVAICVDRLRDAGLVTKGFVGARPAFVMTPAGRDYYLENSGKLDGWVPPK